MRILVLGGTIFLSKAVVRLAVARGHQVTALVRGSRPIPQGAVLHRADRDLGAQAFLGLDGDLSMAAKPSQEWDAVIDVARDPAHVEAALRALSGRVGHWTFVSSISVYANHMNLGQDESAALLPALGPDMAAAQHYGEAKVACEELVLAAGVPSLIARAGLISGPGDSTDRYGYWPARFARDNNPVLVPDLGAMLSQVIDVRDIATWLVDSAESALTGTFDACGRAVPWTTLLGAAMEVTGFKGRVELAAPEWLLTQEVTPWAGAESLPMWLPEEARGMMARSGAAARAVGLSSRPFDQTMEAVLADEKSKGLGRIRQAGLSPERETQLLALLAN